MFPQRAPRSWPWCLVPVLAGLLLSPAMRAGPAEEAQAKRIARLIRQLGDDEFARREAATRELAALGKPALRALRNVAGSSEDPEVRRGAARAIALMAARMPGLLQEAEVVHQIDWPGVHTFTTSFSPDGRYFLAGGDSGAVRLYETKSGKLVHELAGHEHYIGHAIFTPDGKQVLSFSAGHALHVWDVGTGKELRKLAERAGGVYSVDLTRDGKQAVTGCGDGALRLWDFATGKELRKFGSHPGGCVGYFTPDGKQVLSAHGATLWLWDVATGKEVRAFKGHTAPLYDFFLLPGGSQALSYSTDQTARVWDLATGKEVRKLDVGPGMSDIRGLALSPDGKQVLVGGARSTEVRLIELATGAEVHRFALAAPARGLSFSRDGRLAASGAWRGFVYLLRVPGIFDDD